MSKIDVIVKATALVSATIEREAPNAFAVLKEAAQRTRDLALVAKHQGVSQEMVESARDIAKSLSTLIAAYDGAVTVGGEARVVTAEQFHSYVGKQVAEALATEDAFDQFEKLSKLHAALKQATVDEAGEIKLVFTGEIDGSMSLQDVAKSIEDVRFGKVETVWPSDLNR